MTIYLLNNSLFNEEISDRQFKNENVVLAEKITLYAFIELSVLLLSVVKATRQDILHTENNR